ncbi:hypothetical protein [Actinoplanes sp. DH11]|uniref:hypothetical protein n=1 Tax=Actinoplanes sp. DH11 TaxID=2857011 RepID=UPI001E59FB9C|nr:hypothetical protein [Actinoplanes sp. DH11]
MTAAPAVAHAADPAELVLNGTVDKADGTPLTDVVVTVGIETGAEPTGEIIPVTEVGWGWTWADGSFQTWIGNPDVVRASRDANGFVPLVISVPGADGKPAYVYAGPALMGSDNVLRPSDTGSNAGDLFELAVSATAEPSDVITDAGVTPVTGRTVTSEADEFLDSDAVQQSGGYNVMAMAAKGGGALKQVIDNPHLSTWNKNNPPTVSSHGCWKKAGGGATWAVVTAWLQVKRNGKWVQLDKDNKTIRQGCGSKARVPVNELCKGIVAWSDYRGIVDVDIVGYLDPPIKSYSPTTRVWCKN